MKFKKGIYKHFKGHMYKAIGIARHSETLEKLIVYINIEDEDDIWLRPEKMFLENVTRNGKTFPRFDFIKEL